MRYMCSHQEILSTCRAYRAVRVKVEFIVVPMPGEKPDEKQLARTTRASHSPRMRRTRRAPVRKKRIPDWTAGSLQYVWCKSCNDEWCIFKNASGPGPSHGLNIVTHREEYDERYWSL